MNNSVAKQVEEWYGEHSKALSSASIRLRIRSINPSDAKEGKAAIEIETAATLASVALWNLGDVSFTTIDKRSGREVVSDRRLTSGDDIPSLLDGYFRSIINPTDSSE
ncbi:MAG: hypothetical protein WAL56_17805 [Candidatus Sulfotelmatobacter sp.]